MFKSGGAVLRPVGGGAGSLSVLWSAAKMAAGIMIIMPSINPTVVIIRIFFDDDVGDSFNPDEFHEQADH